eukprot:scaffold1346_cov440-Prasinococcus_capsulatus_cf.AAC.2
MSCTYGKTRAHCSGIAIELPVVFVTLATCSRESEVEEGQVSAVPTPGQAARNIPCLWALQQGVSLQYCVLYWM